MVNIDEIKKFFRGRIALSEPLGKHAWFKIGGPADYYLEPADKEDAVGIIRYFEQQQFPYVVIGRGSNLLICDEGVRGAVINLEHGLCSVSGCDAIVTAEAGVRLSRFVEFCVQRGLGGVEMLAGIPGTIGGAVVMNAGAYGGEISDHLVEVEVVRKGSVTTVRKGNAGFAYRQSGLTGDVVLCAHFMLLQGEKAGMIRIRRDLLLRRNETQPLNLPNSGSMFKNPPGKYAAKLIEEAGLKGARRGRAMISDKHANFMVNLGNARAVDVLELIDLARSTVHAKSGITLELEVKLLGFETTIGEDSSV